MERILVLQLENGASTEVRCDEELGLQKGDICVFRRDFFDDLGEVVREIPEPTGHTELPVVKAKAADADLATANNNIVPARSAMETARKLIEQLKLEMNPVNAHYSLDKKLLTIQFCADGRVDFRELVKELSRALSTRIELRQIGVRDETGIHGGIAVCGQPLCCSRFLKEFNSINVRMAKEQDLSLTPSTISGVCGRLKCCLKYEHEGYLALNQTMPRKGDYCDTPSGRGRIIDRNLLTQKVTVAIEGSSNVTFAASEVTVVTPERKPHVVPPRKNDSDRKNQPRKNNRPGNEGQRNKPERKPSNPDKEGEDRS